MDPTSWVPARDVSAFHTQSLRHAAPYIHAHRGHTFVVAFGGEALEDGAAGLIHDLAVIHVLGIRLVLVHGARPQIERAMRRYGVSSRFHQGRRITDAAGLRAVEEAVAATRVAIEARLSMGLPGTPMSGMRLRVVSGNFITARPLGVIDGVDYQYTGAVRRVDTHGIRDALDDGAIVLLSALGYSPTGETFNVPAREVATAAAGALDADKLILLLNAPLQTPQGGRIHHLNVREAAALVESAADEVLTANLSTALAASRAGVRRVHFVNRKDPDALLAELFTREGTGTLVTAEPYEALRRARIGDVAGILELIEPLEAAGVLVRRSREQLELEIDRFVVMDLDGAIIACAALYPYLEERMGELACLAVHPDHRREGRGDRMLARVEDEARRLGLECIFVLTTQTDHWFRERGFEPASLDVLPMPRKQLYNYRRNARVLVKRLPD